MSRLLARLLIAAPLMAAAPLAALPASAQGVSGPYLAAENAARRGDILEAARYFSEAVGKDGENAVLLERAVLHQVAAGRIGTAVALARKLHEKSSEHNLAILVLASDALRRGDAAAARELLGQNAEDEFGFAGQLLDAWAAWGTDDADAARAILEEMEKIDDPGRGRQ